MRTIIEIWGLISVRWIWRCFYNKSYLAYFFCFQNTPIYLLFKRFVIKVCIWSTQLSTIYFRYLRTCVFSFVNSYLPPTGTA